ncbi:MAG: CRISPR-associated helicase Cas3' [Candidatus Sericytochromatia bacterium]|nr:CRISPR-associated helicase Cas3' [Candidatus Sericytochromatia bacterium]
MHGAFVAHTPNSKNKWHGLEDHLKSVAFMSESFAHKFGAGKLGYYAGLWHDIGKINPEFQNYLKACYLADKNKNPPPAKGIDHKTYGSVYSLRSQGLSLLAFPIQGHHGGLPSKTYLQTKINEKQKQPGFDDVLQKAATFFKDIEPLESSDFSRFSNLNVYQSEFFVRMLFSCLVDADFLDTERHFEEAKADKRIFDAGLSELSQRLDDSQNRLSGQKTDLVSKLRHQIYNDCLNSAELPPGIFKLTVPTGGGKTRSSLAFALKHALKHNLDRVIMAIPYTSIIEQTVDVYRQILGNDVVLEHHSNASFKENEENPSDYEIKARLATENWDAPLVVTTNVQFFESLFAHKTSKCRKLHNIARSVVILDEVQTLPVKFLKPILDVLAQLVETYQVTLVFCTATQPAMEKLPELSQLAPIREIVNEPGKIFEKLKRVEYNIQLEQPLTWKQVANLLSKERQALCVVNTKKDALALLSHLPQESVLHLSTLLCGAHRRKVLEEVKERLEQGKSCLLISTQVVEAGVDLDFPTVFRAIGPLDRIVQAAGRCNREGKMNKLGQVFIFEPAEGKIPPGEYRTATDNARSFLRQSKWDLNLPDIFVHYFQAVYQTVDTDGKRIQQMRQSFDYPEVADLFRMIDDDTVPVIVKYDEYVKILLNELQKPWVFPKKILRQLQPYILNIRHNELKKYKQESMVREVTSGVWEWLGKYDYLCGLQSEMMDPEDLVI